MQLRVPGRQSFSSWRHREFVRHPCFLGTVEHRHVRPDATQEDTLGDVAKKAGGFALGALIGKGGSKFGGLDIKRVYFGCVHVTRGSEQKTIADRTEIAATGCEITVRCVIARVA